MPSSLLVQQPKQKLLVITGPTAVGKSAMSVRIAKALGGEILSADSMQVYRRMDIGTAKITPAETEGVPHHLLDVAEPTEEWNVRTFCLMAAPLIEEIGARGALPVVAGGTGFYIRALAYAAEFPDEEDEGGKLRKRLEAMDGEALYARLKEIDPVSAGIIHPNNHKRLVRAVEFFEQNGFPISRHNEAQHANESPYDLIYFVLTMDRTEMYKRIDRRVKKMLEEGLVEEVKGLLREGVSPESVSMQGIGYKETADYLDGLCDIKGLEETIALNTRHFAKRQLTWFRREKDAIFADASDPDRCFEEMINIIKTRWQL